MHRSKPYALLLSHLYFIICIFRPFSAYMTVIRAVSTDDNLLYWVFAEHIVRHSKKHYLFLDPLLLFLGFVSFSETFFPWIWMVVTSDADGVSHCISVLTDQEHRDDSYTAAIVQHPVQSGSTFGDISSPANQDFPANIYVIDLHRTVVTQMWISLQTIWQSTYIIMQCSYNHRISPERVNGHCFDMCYINSIKVYFSHEIDI